MADLQYSSALIIGAGGGISASVARAFGGAGLRVALSARNADKLAGLAGEERNGNGDKGDVKKDAEEALPRAKKSRK